MKMFACWASMGIASDLAMPRAPASQTEGVAKQVTLGPSAADYPETAAAELDSAQLRNGAAV
jgi:hypothetical protein